MKRIRSEVRRRASRSGQAVVEYSLVLAFLTSFCVAVLTPWGAPLRGLYIYVLTSIATAVDGL